MLKPFGVLKQQITTTIPTTNHKNDNKTATVNYRDIPRGKKQNKKKQP